MKIRTILTVLGGVFIILVIIAAVFITLAFVNSRAGYIPKESIIQDPRAALDECKSQTKDYAAEKCYMAIADISEDINVVSEACGSLPSAELSNFCYLNQFHRIQSGKSTQDSASLSLCGEIKSQEMRDECYLSAVRDGGFYDVKICKNIVSIDKMGQCENNVLDTLGGGILGIDGAVEQCELMSGDRIWACFSKVSGFALSSGADKATAVCSRFSDVAESQMTIDVDNCFSNLARIIFTTDPKKATSTCKYIKNILNRDSCMYSWFMVDNYIQSDFDFSIGLCQYMANEDTCYSRIAMLFKDVSSSKAKRACDMISSDSIRRTCFQTIVVET